MNFTCRCGYRFHDNTDELRFKARILPDQDFNEFYTLLEDAGKSHTKEEQHHIFDKIYDLLKKCIYQCPECGRLFLKNSGGGLTMFTPSDSAEPNEDVDRNMLMSAHGASWHGSLLAEWYDPKPVWLPHSGSVGASANPPEPVQWFDTYTETEQTFHVMFEKLRAEDRIDYAEIRVHEQGGTRCLFSWRRENKD